MISQKLEGHTPTNCPLPGDFQQTHLNILQRLAWIETLLESEVDQELRIHKLEQGYTKINTINVILGAVGGFLLTTLLSLMKFWVEIPSSQELFLDKFWTAMSEFLTHDVHREHLFSSNGVVDNIYSPKGA